MESKMSWGKVLTFDDPFLYGAAFRAGEIETFPTEKGAFRSEVTQVALDQLWMARFNERLARVQTGVINRGRQVVGFVTKANQPELYCCGRLLSPGEIQLYDFKGAHYKSGGGFESATMSLPIEDLAAASVAITGRTVPDISTRQFVRPDPELMDRLLRQHQMVGQMAKTTPDLFAAPGVARALEQQLTYTLVKCLTDAATSRATVSALRHDAIVARFEDFLEANPNTSLYLTEVCAAVGTTERTLRHACEEHLGMGPIRYLKLRRMHLVRRALAQAVPSETTVTQIATDHGFWELGRFAVSYRSIFGEVPSQTLQRPSNDRSVVTKRPSHLAAS
jgi:AraC-like DNA-binding protein